MFQYYLPSAEPLELTVIFPRSYVWQPPFVKWTLIHFLWPKLKCIESGISHGTLHDITQCHWQSLAQLKLFGNVSMQMFLLVYSVQCFVLSCHNNRSGKKIKDKVTGNNDNSITCLNKSLDERKKLLNHIR